MFGARNILYQFRSRLGGLPYDAAWHLGLNRSFVTQARGSRILLYHGLCQDDPFRFNTLFLKRQTFESQLRLYKKYFNLISLDDFYQQRFSDKRFNLSLTFDDGFANNHKYVLPLLEQYQVPATFFVTGISAAGYDVLWNDALSIAYRYGPDRLSLGNDEFVKTGKKKYIAASTGRYLDDILRSTGFEDKAKMIGSLGSFIRKAPGDYWLQMTTEEIRSLSGSKWATVGSHSYYHNDLAKISAASVKEELGQSKQYLENITGKEIKAFAFPYGSYTKEAVELAKDTGYTQLLATAFLFDGDTGDATLRERLTINPFISNINQLHANITGNY